MNCVYGLQIQLHCAGSRWFIPLPHPVHPGKAIGTASLSRVFVGYDTMKDANEFDGKN